MSSDFPENVREFMRNYINSVAILELLILIKNQPHREWTATEVSAEMRTNPSYASLQLNQLVDAKVLEHTDRKGFYRYRQDSPHHEVILQLEELYHLKKSSIINQIYSQPLDSLRDFANAFKIKRDI